MIAESNEGNNEYWQDIYVGFAGSIEVNSGSVADDPAYETETGFGYIDEGQPDVISGSGDLLQDTVRRDPDGEVFYQFDHLLPGHSYHLDLTLYEPDGAGRVESIYVDGTLITPEPVDLSDGQIHAISIRLDPALYADHSIRVSIVEPGIDGAVVNGVKLHDILYHYLDAGGSGEQAYSPENSYGWLDGSANTSWGTLPYQSVRIDQSDNTLRYQYDQLDPTRRYNLHLTFWQPSGTARVQKNISGRRGDRHNRRHWRL